jgi:phosphoserine phosphatase RsbU/P
VVGIDPSQRYQRGTYDLQRGDVLVAYTDGLPDTLDFSGKKFGKARLRQAVLTALAADGEAPAAKIVEHIFWELRQFAGILERPDDQTVVVLRVRD